MLRNSTPSRRSVPTKKPTGNKWQEHKADLREDFNRHCAYCDCFDGYRDSFFEVDHFIPQSILKIRGTISVTDYQNLVYSCRHCNNAKRAKWPSGDEAVLHNGREGFVDPCTKEWEDHLYRTADGGIMWKTEVGKWMWQKAFKFDERQNAIKLLYNINKLRLIIDESIDVCESLDSDGIEYKQAMKTIKEMTFTYYKYHRELMDFYN